MSYKKWTDGELEELRKALRQNRINFVKSEARIIALFAMAILVYLAAANKMWWLLCGGAWFLATCIFVYSMCNISQRSDERLGLNEWQQEAKDEH